MINILFLKSSRKTEAKNKEKARNNPQKTVKKIIVKISKFWIKYLAKRKLKERAKKAKFRLEPIAF